MSETFYQLALHNTGTPTHPGHVRPKVGGELKGKCLHTPRCAVHEDPLPTPDNSFSKKMQRSQPTDKNRSCLLISDLGGHRRQDPGFKGDQEPGELPSEELLTAMGKYNEELTKAGVLLDLSGLHPSAEGVRVKYSGGKTTVVDGPFVEPKETVAGYWILQVKSMDEAVEWAKRVPVEAAEHEYGRESEIEIRQIFELEEFGESPAIDRARELEKELENEK
jgi:hypothetical protein